MPPQPKRPNGKPDPKTPAPKVVTIEIDGQKHTMSAEAAEALREAIASGRFTGFRSYAEDGKS